MYERFTQGSLEHLKAGVGDAWEVEMQNRILGGGVKKGQIS